MTNRSSGGLARPDRQPHGASCGQDGLTNRHCGSSIKGYQSFLKARRLDGCRKVSENDVV